MMANLEKSVRHEMAYFGPKMRAGGYWAISGHTTGEMRPNFRTFECAKCDYDPETGIVTDIRLYAYGDAHRVSKGSTWEIDMSEPICRYLKGEDPEYSGSAWDSMIQEIVDVIQAEVLEIKKGDRT